MSFETARMSSILSFSGHDRPERGFSKRDREFRALTRALVLFGGATVTSKPRESLGTFCVPSDFPHGLRGHWRHADTKAVINRGIGGNDDTLPRSVKIVFKSRRNAYESHKLVNDDGRDRGTLLREDGRQG